MGRLGRPFLFCLGGLDGIRVFIEFLSVVSILVH